MHQTRKYCTNCNLAYEIQSFSCCSQCGSTESAPFILDERHEDLTRFLVNRQMKEYTNRKNNDQQF